MDKMELDQQVKKERLEMSLSNASKRTTHPLSGFAISDILEKIESTPEERALRSAHFKKIREQRKLGKMLD